MSLGLALRRVAPLLALAAAACGTPPSQPSASSRLLADKIVAFGDSMTAGENGREGTGSPVPASTSCRTVAAIAAPQLHPRFIDEAHAYPSALSTLVTAAFPSQSVRIANEGNPGESSDEGATRLTCVLKLWQPNALVLLEGVNDLAAGGTDDVTEVVARLESAMTRNVATARAAGVTWIYIASIPPPGACSGTTPCRARASADIQLANAALKRVATAAGVGFIDVFQNFAAAGSLANALVDTDGLHLTPAGYALVAESVFVSLPMAR